MNLFELPIAKHLGKVISLLQKDRCLILSTPTGSGKTLLVPAFVQDHFGGRVFVTVPRVLLAKSAARAVQEYIHNNVGYITGRGEKNPDAGIIYITEGSLINRVTLHPSDILCVDEVHEQGINTELVLYTAKKHLENGGRVIVMSATMDMAKYQNYLGGNVFSYEEARQFEIEKVISDDTLSAAQKIGGRILIGVPGKGEMEQVRRRLWGYQDPIFDLHSEVEEEDEKAAMSYMGDCIYIATSVAMSGITFSNLDVVCVPEVGRRIEDGRLVDYTLSHAEQTQWAGRVGRVKDGTAIYERSYVNREDNPTPEILRADLREIVLTFSTYGIDINSIELLNNPEKSKIERAISWLKNMGLYNTLDGVEIVKMGRGLTFGLLSLKGRQYGCESFAQKVATLVELGTPFRKNITAYYRDLLNNDPLAKISDHYAVIETVENDPDLMDSPLILDFCKSNNIFLKGVKKLQREFKRIGKHNVTEEQIKAFFGSLEPENIFESDYNSEIGFIKPSFTSFATGERVYATLAPISVRGGRLANLITKIN